MSRAKVKKLKVKRNTSIKSLHEAFPDMKSWALRASAGHICYSVHVSAEGFEWQKMVRVRTPRCGGRLRVSQDHCADVQILGVQWAARTLHNVSAGMMRLMLLPELVTTCPVAAPIPHTHIHTHTPFFRSPPNKRNQEQHAHTRNFNSFNKVCMPLFRPSLEGFEP